MLSHSRRHLLIFAATGDDPNLTLLRRDLIQNQDAAAERHLEVHEFIGETGDREALAARERYDVDPGSFCTILVGKDGGEKRRDSRAVPIEEIFALIDSMPMRRREMGRE